MDSKQARRILECYRPRVDDADPQFAEALEQARRDPELGRWLADRCALYDAIRTKLRQIPVPGDLRDRLLKKVPQRIPVVWWRRPAFAGALIAAALALNAVMYLGYWHRPAGPQVVQDFAAYRLAMANFAATGYRMDLQTNDTVQIRRYLAQQSSPSDIDAPPGLSALPMEGCRVVDWSGRKISLVCYVRAASETSGRHEYAWFFVARRAGLLGEPASETPRFAEVGGLATASWSRGDKIYIAAIRGEQADLEKLL